MAEKNQLFAFTVGEVSPAFYGRLDLQKYPLGLKIVENLFVDYHGGLLNRAGREFIAALAPQVHLFAKFKARKYNLTCLFLVNKMLVLKQGEFIFAAAPVNSTIAAGVIPAGSPPAVGRLVKASGGGVSGYFTVTASGGGNFTIAGPLGMPIPDGAVTWTLVYELATTFTADELKRLKVYQDLKKFVCTVDTRLPVFITRTDDDNWALANFSNVLPPAPTGLAGTASASGSASVGFAVTAVVDGVESASSVQLITNSIVNYTTTTGHFTLTWAAVAGAERYNVYRSLVYPAAYPTGAQLSYVGYTTGLSFVDRNITGDGSKSPPVLADFFAGNNFPSVYARFQQRGVYAGLANDPLTLVASSGLDKGIFSLSFPTVATDSYSYTLDSESERPIKHMLSLRYGLMTFTDDGITQLRGGEGIALSAVSAIAEPQGFVSVGDLDPIAINLDVLFMTSLNSEFNQMVYTEYTNSFKMQDILVLSTHLFGYDNQALEITWAPEPFKLLHFVRADGEMVSLTYERNLEVYGWVRNRTKGLYQNVMAVEEDGYNVTYQTVVRRVQNIEAMFLEREKPRNDNDFSKMWFVDAGWQRKPIFPAFDATLVKEGEGEGADWSLRVSNTAWAAVDQLVYVLGGIFRITFVSPEIVQLEVVHEPLMNLFYLKNRRRAPSGTWGYNTAISSVEGLWWLEGETVSVLADGDAFIDKMVVNGQVTFESSYGCILVGLGYNCDAETLPLSLPNYVLGGDPLSLRQVALRQLNSRGLSIGTTFDNLEELPSRSDELWGSPLKMATGLEVIDLFGLSGWALEAQICFRQAYPLPCGIIGLTFDLDVGD